MADDGAENLRKQIAFLSSKLIDMIFTKVSRNVLNVKHVEVDQNVVFLICI